MYQNALKAGAPPVVKMEQEAQLSPKDRAMRRVIEILPVATQQCRNYLYDKS